MQSGEGWFDVGCQVRTLFPFSFPAPPVAGDLRHQNTLRRTNQTHKAVRPLMEGVVTCQSIHEVLWWLVPKERTCPFGHQHSSAQVRAGGAAQSALSRSKGSRSWRGSSEGLKARLVSPCPAAPSPAPAQRAEDITRLPQGSG